MNEEPTKSKKLTKSKRKFHYVLVLKRFANQR